ncbi:MAG: ABC transporter ATP-binding protein [Rikenellaceae bacterium]
MKKNIMWVINLIKGYRLYILLNIVLGVLAVGLSLLFIYLSKLLVDRAVAKELQDGIMLPIIQISGVIIFQQACNFLRGSINTRSTTKMMNSLREKLFRRVMLSKWNGKEKFHTGDITTRFDVDVRKVSSTICETLPMIVVTITEFFFSFFFMLTLNNYLAWILFIIMPICFLLSKKYIFKIRKLTHSMRAVDSSIQSHIQEQVQSRGIINAMGNTKYSIASLCAFSNDLFNKTMNRTNYTLYSSTVVRLGFASGYLTAFFWGVNGLSSGAVTFGVMTAFLQLVAKIQTPIVEVSSQVSVLAQTMTSIDRLIEIESLEMEKQGEPKIIEGSVGLKLKDVTFSYGKKAVLSNFEYDFEPNKLHIIIGETGSGKSTMLKLILGFILPESGNVELYNSSKRVACTPLSRINFVYVPQGNTLISGTIRENLLLGNISASDDDIKEVLHLAVADFVYHLPEGLDTVCGERGAGISEGEAQRIAIARGLLHKGSILLLDEPTSALDSETERLLIQRLSDYAKNRTMIMVTHRKRAGDLCSSVVKLTKIR